MAWRRIGDKPLSEPMLSDSLTHICGTRGDEIMAWWWHGKTVHITQYYWPFVRGTHPSHRTNDPSQRGRALIFSLLLFWKICWTIVKLPVISDTMRCNGMYSAPWILSVVMYLFTRSWGLLHWHCANIMIASEATLKNMGKTEWHQTTAKHNNT